LEDLGDITLEGHEKQAARKVMKLALMCLGGSLTRPSMGQIVKELERILADLGPYHTYDSGHIAVVTLGSDLFK